MSKTERTIKAQRLMIESLKERLAMREESHGVTCAALRKIIDNQSKDIKELMLTDRLKGAAIESRDRAITQWHEWKDRVYSRLELIEPLFDEYPADADL